MKTRLVIAILGVLVVIAGITYMMYSFSNRKVTHGHPRTDPALLHEVIEAYYVDNPVEKIPDATTQTITTDSTSDESSGYDSPTTETILTYDPTNGTNSESVMWHIKQ